MVGRRAGHHHLRHRERRRDLRCFRYEDAVPASPRIFESQDAFVEFLKTRLNAEVVEEKGETLGYTMRGSLIGDAYWMTELGDAVRVSCDFIGDYLVGEFGHVEVAGERVYIERKPCWEEATEYLTGVRRGTIALAGAGGGCSSGGFCIANATWSGFFPFIYRAWGSSTFQARSQFTCRGNPFIPWMLQCTGLPTSPNVLSASGGLVAPLGGLVLSCPGCRRTVSGTNVLRVDAEFVEWKWPGSPGGIVYSASGVCGSSMGTLSVSPPEITFARSNEPTSVGGTVCRAGGF